MQRISGPLIVIVFALIALLWPYVHSIPWPESSESISGSEIEPSPSQVERVIEFCLDKSNANNKLCRVEDPETVEDFKEAVTPTPAPVPQVRSGGSSDPIIVREESSREESSSRTVTNNTRSGGNSAPTPDQSPPDNDDGDAVDIPVPLDIPVDVPEVDVPLVGKVKVTESDPILPAEAD